MQIRYENIRDTDPSANADAVEAGGTLAGNCRIGSRSAAEDYVRSLPADFAGSLLALYVSRDFDLLALDRLGQGNAADCGLKPYVLVRRGLELGAIGFILVHNAPERTSKASAEEYRITREIRRAGEDFEVHLLDHLILGRDRLMQVAA